MDQRVIEFFENKQYPVKRILAKAPKGLTETQIYAGLTEVFKRVEAGEKIRDINLVREAFACAKKLDDLEFVREQATIDDLKAKLQKAEQASQTLVNLVKTLEDKTAEMKIRWAGSCALIAWAWALYELIFHWNP